jgi:TolA-binding protein
MRLLQIILGTLIVFFVTNVYADYKSRNLGDGWIAMTEQTDPFDTSKVAITQIMKDIVTVRCNNISWLRASDLLFDSYSFSAKIKYMVDGGSPVDKKGSQSTYLGGSDMVNNDSYFSFQFDEADLNTLKKGTALKLAGRTSTSGWETRALDLTGFEAAYIQMCGVDSVEREKQKATNLEIRQDYEAATNKLLEDLDTEAAAIALNAHLEKYPNSPFAPNTHFWLGEIYLLNGQNELARQAFTIITEQYVGHSKMMDSSFKLGKIYFEVGELEKARNLIELVAKSSDQVASKARSFLVKNFQ